METTTNVNVIGPNPWAGFLKGGMVLSRAVIISSSIDHARPSQFLCLREQNLNALSWLIGSAPHPVPQTRTRKAPDLARLDTLIGPILTDDLNSVRT